MLDGNIVNFPVRFELQYLALLTKRNRKRFVLTLTPYAKERSNVLPIDRSIDRTFASLFRRSMLPTGTLSNHLIKLTKYGRTDKYLYCQRSINGPEVPLHDMCRAIGPPHFTIPSCIDLPGLYGQPRKGRSLGRKMITVGPPQHRSAHDLLAD